MSDETQARFVCFQPTPRFVSEGNGLSAGEPLLFQPTPRFVSEGNSFSWFSVRELSRFQPHPPLRQRGERERWPAHTAWFQPTPRFVSEGNKRPTVCDRWEAVFQLTPRFVQREGTRVRHEGGGEGAVSTHPSLREQGEPPSPRTGRRSSGWFQTHPPLRQRGEASGLFGIATERNGVSTHPPLRQRGEPDDAEGRSIHFSIFFSPLAPSARGTSRPRAGG